MNKIKNLIKTTTGVVFTIGLALGLAFSAKADFAPDFLLGRQFTNFVLTANSGTNLTVVAAAPTFILPNVEVGSAVSNLENSAVVPLTMPLLPPFQLDPCPANSNTVSFQTLMSAANAGNSNVVFGFQTSLDYQKLGLLGTITWVTNALNGTNPVTYLNTINTGSSREIVCTTNFTTQTNAVTINGEFGQFRPIK